MGLIAAKCTQCGANIEVDDSKEAGICKYCGTAFITEKAIINYNTYITNNNNFSGANINIVGRDIKNFLEIGNNSLKARNGKEAFEYANKALEIKADSSDAWLMKMKALEYIGTIGDPRVGEIVTCGKNAIQYAFSDKKEETEKEVYKYYLSRALSLLVIATDQINNDIKELKHQAIKLRITNNSNTVELMDRLTYDALILKNAVPKKKILNREEYEEEYQNFVKAIANQYVKYSKALIERYLLCGQTLFNSQIELRRQTLRLFKDGLNEENQKDIPESEIKTRACYIATCVYGSYDCPQVWTLRRYRDGILNKTWYGRAFIKCYYTISPTLVKWFGNTKWFRNFWKLKLDKIVNRLIQKGIANTYYNDKY